MNLRKYQQILGSLCANRMHTLPKETSFTVHSGLDEQKLKHHPGKTKLGCISVPPDLENRLRKTLHNFALTNVFQEARALETYLLDRRCPTEKTEVYEMKQKLTEEFKLKNENLDLTEDEIEQRIEMRLKQKIRPSLQIKYSHRECLLYLVARFAPEFSSLLKIFSEIKKRDESFEPRHLFDFGSGLGSVMWAANAVWPSHQINEIINVDSAVAMISLAEQIARGGSLDGPLAFPGLSFKLNSPKSYNEKFELVVSAFSQFEHPTQKARFEALLMLWAKLKPGGYLVLCEIGTTHGFRLMDEARDFFLNCSHHLTCPAKEEGHKCKFNVTYWPLQLQSNQKNQNSKTFAFSYLVLKKSTESVSPRWPRLVLENPQKHGKSYQAKLCCPDGKLHHLVSASNRCKTIRKLVRFSTLGDSLPIAIHLKPKD